MYILCSSTMWQFVLELVVSVIKSLPNSRVAVSCTCSFFDFIGSVSRNLFRQAAVCNHVDLGSFSPSGV